MSAPLSVNNRSSVEIKNSCNSCCCPWRKKKHHKRDACDKTVQTVKEVATLKAIPSDALRQPQTMPKADTITYQIMPAPGSNDLTRIAEGSGK